MYTGSDKNNITCTSKVTALCEGGEIPDIPDNPDTPDDPKPNDPTVITVRAKVPAHWTNTITAWVWPTGGNGREVNPTQEGEWYVVSEKTDVLNIIFKNGAGWNGNANQTEDMTFTSNACIQLSQSGDAKARYTTTNCDDDTAVEDIHTNPMSPHKVLINGALYLVMPNGKVYDVCGTLIR
jgi:hypothetical protein